MTGTEAKIRQKALHYHDERGISTAEIASVWMADHSPEGGGQTIAQRAEPSPELQAGAVSAVKAEAVKCRYWQLSLIVCWQDIKDAALGMANPMDAIEDSLAIERYNEFPWADRELLERLEGRLLDAIAADNRVAKAAANIERWNGLEGGVLGMIRQTTRAESALEARKARAAVIADAYLHSSSLLDVNLWLGYRSPANAKQVSDRIRALFYALSNELGYNVGYDIKGGRFVTAQNCPESEPNRPMTYIANIEERGKEDSKLLERLCARMEAGEIVYRDIRLGRYCTALFVATYRTRLREVAELVNERIAYQFNAALESRLTRRINLLIIADPRAGGNTSDIGKSYLTTELVRRLCVGSIRAFNSAGGSDPLSGYEGEAVLTIEEHTGSNTPADYLKKMLEPEKAIMLESRYYNKANVALVNIINSCRPMDATDTPNGAIEGYRANIAQCFRGQDVWQFWRRINYVIRVNIEGGERRYSVDIPRNGSGDYGSYGVRFEPIAELQDITLGQLLEGRIVAECRTALRRGING